ncbi:hypothetical protein IWQ60_001374 [Tieghemiomyces parasiticus]|uniref:Peptidase S1 domain-containing protein n=1 Tax=Tieghemiomyces parasiticus TaxID=78921 RepID=A0A9W8E1Y5_9FUNG|nr:hypothetical protein IWQ60_001374 [Tieghemiomyces parasiticus]
MRFALTTASLLGLLLVTVSVKAGPNLESAASALDAAQVERIIGGTAVDGRPFPFAALLNVVMSSGTALCGGSLISNQYVLTAAHCVTDETNGRPVAARAVTSGLGSNDLDQITPYASSQIYVHPDYDYQNVVNDIAIIKLKTTVEFIEGNLEPVQIADNRLRDGQVLQAIGWGKTSNDGYVSDNLRQVDLTVGPTSVCRKANPDFKSQNGPQLCTARNENHDTCQGDSGGPVLFKESDGKYKLAGITSYGFTPGSTSADCGTDSVVAFYTRPDYYIDWISETTGVSKSNLVGSDSSSSSSSSSSGDGPSPTSTSHAAAAGLPGSTGLVTSLMVPVGLVALVTHL